MEIISFQRVNIYTIWALCALYCTVLQVYLMETVLHNHLEILFHPLSTLPLPLLYYDENQCALNVYYTTQDHGRFSPSFVQTFWCIQNFCNMKFIVGFPGEKNFYL